MYKVHQISKNIVGLVEILTNLLKSIILMVEYLYKQLLDLLHITFNNYIMTTHVMKGIKFKFSHFRH
jgi:hypothetical protein